jgi:hypothetical protein
VSKEGEAVASKEAGRELQKSSKSALGREPIRARPWAQKEAVQ